MSTAFTEPSRPRRRAWPWIVAVVVVAVVAAIVVAEVVVRAAAREAVRDRIVEAFALEPDAQVAVDLGTAPVLPQLVTGRLAVLDARIPELAIGELTVSVAVHAEGVPVTAGEPVERIEARVAVGEEDVRAATAELVELPEQEVEFDDGEIVVSGTVQLLGFDVPIGIGLRPGVDGGAIVFTPTSFRLGDEVLSAEALAENAVFRSVAGSLLQQQPVCVAEHLPAGLVLESAELTGDRLEVLVTGDRVPISTGGDSGSCG